MIMFALTLFGLESDSGTGVRYPLKGAAVTSRLCRQAQSDQRLHLHRVCRKGAQVASAYATRFDNVKHVLLLMQVSPPPTFIT